MSSSSDVYCCVGHCCDRCERCLKAQTKKLVAWLNEQVGQQSDA